MASTTETGNAVNISNFKLLIDTCTGFGAAYSPSNTSIKISDMGAKWVIANDAQTTIITALQESKEPINEREIAFEPLGKLVTRTISYLNSTTANAQVKKDAKGLADQIRGFNKVKPKAPGAVPDVEAISTSHLSYVKRAENFLSLITLYGTITEYSPNETELKTAGLNTYYTDLKKLNDKIGTILSPVNMARIERDKQLYAEGTGIVYIAEACKQYVKSLYGATAPETKLVTKIKFRKK